MEEIDLDTVTTAVHLIAAYVQRTRLSLAPSAFPDVGAAPGRVRGPVQQAIVDLPDMMDVNGMRPTEIAAQIEYSVPNTYRLLRTLCETGVLETVPSSGPQRWRLSKAHRQSPSVFRRFAETVGPGEWTTCADLSIAGRGDLFAARLVCWAAEHVPEFPHPHRVLLEGGVPHPEGHDHRRLAPRQVRALLVGEGLSFTPTGCAAPARRVTWDQLRERALGRGGVRSPAHGLRGMARQRRGD